MISLIEILSSSKQKQMLLSLLSSLWIRHSLRHSLHGNPVYSETSHAVGSSGWSVELRVSNEALTVLGYILALFMAVGGKYGVLDYVVAVFFGMPAYPFLSTTPLLTVKRAGETCFVCKARQLEYGTLYFIARYRSLVWLVLYVSLSTLLVHPMLVNEAKAFWYSYLKKPYKDETVTVRKVEHVREAEYEVVQEIDEVKDEKTD